MSYFNLKAQIPIHRKILSNGLDIIVAVKKKAPIVSVNLAYKVGSKNERPGLTGFAHLFEHMMFEGTKTIQKGDFDKLCSSAGGTNNAYTTYDWTSYIMTLPKHQLELGLWLESDRMINYDVDPKALKNQQKVVSEEIRQTVENHPYAKWREALSRNAYGPDCCYSWEVHGSIKDVKGANLEDAVEFQRANYKPNNAALALVGDVDPEEAFELVEKYFGKAQKNDIIYHDVLFSDELRKKGTYEAVTDNVQLAATFASFHIDGFYNDNIFTAEVLTNIASSGRSSRLYENLVYNKQIASSIGAYVDKRERSSLLTFYAIANAPEITAEQLYAELYKEAYRFAEEKVLDMELEKSENILLTEAAHELQYSSGIADFIANQALFFNEPERLYTLLDKYKKVNSNDILNFSKKYINENNMVRIDVTPDKIEGI